MKRKGGKQCKLLVILTGTGLLNLYQNLTVNKYITQQDTGCGIRDKRVLECSPIKKQVPANSSMSKTRNDKKFTRKY